LILLILVQPLTAVETLVMMERGKLLLRMKDYPQTPLAET
jgi:hypothetical protein